MPAYILDNFSMFMYSVSVEPISRFAKRPATRQRRPDTCTMTTTTTTATVAVSTAYLAVANRTMTARYHKLTARISNNPEGERIDAWRAELLAVKTVLKEAGIKLTNKAPGKVKTTKATAPVLALATA